MKNNQDKFTIAEHFVVRMTSLISLIAAAIGLIIFAVKHALATLH